VGHSYIDVLDDMKTVFIYSKLKWGWGVLQHCTQYHLYTAVLLENEYWVVQQNRDTSR